MLNQLLVSLARKLTASLADGPSSSGKSYMKWITRERPKIDRVACPGLVRCFIDGEIKFLYVSTEQVFTAAKEIGATPYNIPGTEPFSHDGQLCSFDAFIKHYKLADPRLLTWRSLCAAPIRHDLI